MTVASEAAREAAELVQALVDRGLTQKMIGGAVGRNDSLISQIRRGTGKGGSLVEQLREVRDKLDALTAAGRKPTAETLTPDTPAPRRQTARGSIARVRRAVTVKGNGWSTATVKAQAARAGGNGLLPELEDAARDGRNVAFDVTFRAAGKVRVMESSGRPAKRTRKAAGHKQLGWTVTLGDGGNLAAQTALAAINQEGSVVAGVLKMMADRGLISYDGTPADTVSDGEVVSVEMRTFA